MKRLEQALELIPDLISDERNRKRVKRCGELMEKDRDFPEAVEKTGLFEPLHRRITSANLPAACLSKSLRTGGSMRLAFTSRFLPPICHMLESLSGYYEREDRLQASIRSAVAYPLLLYHSLPSSIPVPVCNPFPYGPRTDQRWHPSKSIPRPHKPDSRHGTDMPVFSLPIWFIWSGLESRRENWIMCWNL